MSFRSAIFWMLIFIVIVLVSAIFDPSLLGEPLIVTDKQKIIFYIMNIGVALSVVFAASTWFVKTIQLEKNKSEKLLGKIKTLFGQHVSTEIANELISKKAEAPDSKIINATMMFLDIRDFTVFADSKKPSEVDSFQNILFSEFIDIIKDNKGIVIQILGDGLYAVFGAPNINDTHIFDAVNAGYKMLDKTKELINTKKIPFIKLGIGIHSGNVVAGEVGNDFRKSYSLAGSNVIITSRIEQLNKVFKSQFLISDVVFKKVSKSLKDYEYKGEQKLKGISDTVGIYKLL